MTQGGGPLRVAAGYACLRHVAAEAPEQVGSYIVQSEGDQLRLTSRRTGREHTVRASVTQESAGQLTIDVSSDTPAPRRLTLADLPERQRLAVTGALRREIIARRFTPAEVAELSTGSADLPHVAARALLRAVAGLEHEQSSDASAAVTDLADLFHLMQLSIPFDVQTAFYAIRAKAPRDVARRLGFEEGD